MLVATDVASRGLDIPNVDLVIQVEPPKETETYIHRSGRTARAGKTGTCITFWTLKHKQQLQNIEHKAGFKFTQIGIPQPEDLLKAASRDTIKQLETVNDDILPSFDAAAEELIAMCGGDKKKALKKALAFMSGCHKEKLANRSLLNGQENCITYQIDLKQTFNGPGLIWNMLRRYAPETITNEIKGLRALADKTGAVFDLEDRLVSAFDEVFEKAKEGGRQMDFELYKCKALPDLLESQ